VAERLDDEALNTLFRTARAHDAWTDRPVPDGTLREVYDLAKWGPTSANAGPARLVFGHVKSNFICNLGCGDPSKLFPRLSCLEFAEACLLL
jgi:nitroreductase